MEEVYVTPWWKLVLVCLWGFTLIPLPNAFDIRGWKEMHPLNNAQWSLMWEYIANILYALVIRHFKRWMLIVLVLLSACLTLMLCMNIDIFGVLTERTLYAHTVIGGWSIEPEHILIAITRLSYPFFMGLLVSRMFSGADGGKKTLCLEKFHINGGFWWCTLAIITLFCMPRVGGAIAADFWKNGLYEAFVILVCFPLIVSIGAGSKITGAKGQAVCKLLGDISYPLYVTHYPLIYFQMSFAASHPDLPDSIHVAVSVSLFILAVLMAYASLKLYDLPIREWLRHRLF
ncbi:MAG: acyltransferase family protein [Prevotellaceae bacterium]|nr:acyltransferase family protein [Prevotellaceae bacterium]